jgi:uncharacterized membrane protein YuzA (DUF378 family)
MQLLIVYLLIGIIGIMLFLLALPTMIARRMIELERKGKGLKAEKRA